MGADLFGSYVATMLAAMVLGNYSITAYHSPGGTTADMTDFNGMGPILMPVLIAGLGIIFSIIGTFFVRIKDNTAKENKVQGAFNLANWSSLVMTGVASYFIIKWMLPAKMYFTNIEMKCHAERKKHTTRKMTTGQT